ncbi:MAG: class I SAM-dependent methyltransferase [Trebonia sp.]
MNDDVRFASDLYRGSAAHYDRYRLPYPGVLISDLVSRVAPSGRGRVLDLACGTGQLTFPFAGRFAEAWAVDQEPDMIDFVRAKAASAGLTNVRPVVSSAEEFRAGAGAFELIAIGNAFHRLRREVVAKNAREWLQPGGYLALCWSFSPWDGAMEWQRAFGGLLDRWKTALGATHRVPARHAQARRELPDAELLMDCGFQMVGRYEFGVEQQWTLPELAGLIRSTSFLPASVLAEHGAEFDADLAAVLGPYTSEGRIGDVVSFAYEFARK